MPPYIKHVEMWNSIWPIILVVTITSLILCYVLENGPNRKELFLVVLAFSLLGMVTGYLTGFSREPAVAAVMPAVLSLIGGLTIFLVGKNKESRKIVAVSVCVFSLYLLIGASWGSVMRDESEKFYSSELYLKQKAYIEKNVKDFRESLGLKNDDDDPPMYLRIKPE